MLSGSTLQTHREKALAQELIESEGLRFESDAEELVGLFDNGQLVACGARTGYVLKMVAIAPAYQGTEALGEVVTLLVNAALSKGFDTLFVFTRPESVASFQALNFRPLVQYGQAALLEFGPGIEAYLAAQGPRLTEANHAAIVINANPFSLGHQHLIEHASSNTDRLFVFVVREDRSIFPFAVRMRLVQEGTSHLSNITVLDTSRYAVSAGTFPSYFIKKLDDISLTQMQLDVRLFAEHIAPYFSITKRWVGEEPICATTRAYNEVMRSVLAEHGLAWEQIPRLREGAQPISATRIRACLADGDLEGLRELVPASTFRFLRSPEAQALGLALRRTEP